MKAACPGRELHVQLARGSHAKFLNTRSLLQCEFINPPGQFYKPAAIREGFVGKEDAATRD